jgi:hypothetical protein
LGSSSPCRSNNEHVIAAWPASDSPFLDSRVCLTVSQKLGTRWADDDRTALLVKIDFRKRSATDDGLFLNFGVGLAVSQRFKTGGAVTLAGDTAVFVNIDFRTMRVGGSDSRFLNASWDGGEDVFMCRIVRFELSWSHVERTWCWCEKRVGWCCGLDWKMRSWIEGFYLSL